MSDKLINVRHHVDDYECMWNGIEDLYITKSGEHLPNFFFFSLAGIGNFIYLRTPKGAIKRQAMWNDGRTKKMYERLAPIVGFSYKHIEGRSFSYMLKRAKSNIDAGNPVVLGCLDMYYLSYYPKFYLKEHIPIHYVLMVGYNDERKCIYIQDCGVQDIRELSYACLEDALNVKKTDLSDKNAMCTISFNEMLPDVKEIAIRAFEMKARSMLEPPVGFIGIKGMRKLAKEFSLWKSGLTEDEYRAALQNIVMFTGTVPVLPDALLKPEEQNGIQHKAAREKLVNVLKMLSANYGIDEWKLSAQEFEKSGRLLWRMTNRMVDYLIGKSDNLDDIPELIMQIADIEEKAFSYMLSGTMKK